MPPHIKKRGDRGGYYYLVDGEVRKSLETKKKGLAEHRLQQYIQGSFDFNQKILIKEYYERWIEQREKDELKGLIRKSALRDYRQHFATYILPELGAVSMAEVTPRLIEGFRAKLLDDRSLKTVRNIIDSSFRAMWRAARKEKAAKEDPFQLVEWPTMHRPAPDPFTAEERDAIVAYWKDHDFFYFPWVAHHFRCGMRPSETAALRRADVKGLELTISKSRNMGTEAGPKTKHSWRTIVIAQEHADLLGILPAHAMGLDYLFVNKFGKPMSKKWAEHNWGKALLELGIRHRKFYCTRHTFITEKIRSGWDALAVAQYCGTSVAMIQEDYCGRLDLDRTKIAPQASNYTENMVAGPGFEPGNDLARMRAEVQQLREFKRLETRKSA